MHLQEALDRFLLQLEADGRAANTIASYRRHIQLLTSWLAQQSHGGDVREVNHQDLARFLTSPSVAVRADGRPKKGTSMNALRSSLTVFFGYLHRAGVVPADPSRLIRRAHCEPSPARGLTDDEQERLLGALANGQGEKVRRDHTLFALMLGTGIRLGAALALDVYDVDLDAGEVRLRSGKWGREQVVFVGHQIREQLRTHTSARSEGPLFTSRARVRMSARQAQRRFACWLRCANVSTPASPHSLRHSFAQGLYERTRDILLVKQALGHRSLSATLVYAEASQEDLRRILGSSQ